MHLETQELESRSCLVDVVEHQSLNARARAERLTCRCWREFFKGGLHEE
jgi:hypothetical protein